VARINWINSKLPAAEGELLWAFEQLWSQLLVTFLCYTSCNLDYGNWVGSCASLLTL
jgi:hypothetical protein